MSDLSPVLGIDFGTSNSACGIPVGRRPHLIEIDPGARTLPTAVFFDFDTRRTLFGHPANRALIEGATGRYMRGLKSLLGTGLMREKRRILQERLDFIEITGRFLAHVKSRAEAVTGQSFTAAVSGRPVVFHDAHPERDAQAEVDLRDAYAAAGFTEVRFVNEPEAAARAYGDAVADGALGLVVDIGGGTSDFTLFRAGNPLEILASRGLRRGGTDFDRSLSIARAMPALGKGTLIRHAFGTDTHLAPNAIFNDLATWAKIPFLYGPDTRRAARDLAQNAVEPDKLARLVKVLGDELGHDMAFAVEAAKIAANTGCETQIELPFIAADLTVPLSRAAIAADLAQDALAIAETARAALAQAAVDPKDLAGLILVGGSSLMTVVTDALSTALPGVPHYRRAALTAVADGLALAAGDGP